MGILGIWKNKIRHSKAGKAEKRRLPRHIAIVMDGNRRWAKKRGVPSSVGYSFGAENFRKIATYCKNIGIEFLTVYAFSTVIWLRGVEEVASILSLLDKYLNVAIEKMEKEILRLYILGNTEVLSPKIRSLVEKTRNISQGLQGFQVNLCLNYGGRDEILRAAYKYALDSKAGKINKPSQEEFSNFLYTAGIPDPDLVIRPSGEIRISNFLLWQSAYSEFYFTQTLWPDFDEHELELAIEAYGIRERRFGGA